jgi:hypothetical protein
MPNAGHLWIVDHLNEVLNALILEQRARTQREKAGIDPAN